MITSLEIANLLNKRHYNVKRSILRHGIKHDTQYYYRDNGSGVKIKTEMFVVDDDVLSLFKLEGVALQRCQELIALTTIEQLQGVKLIRQYSVLGKYRIDGYDPVNNIAYEIDEKHHFTPQQIDADRIREREIKAELGCEFVRIRI